MGKRREVRMRSLYVTQKQDSKRRSTSGKQAGSVAKIVIVVAAAVAGLSSVPENGSTAPGRSLERIYGKSNYQEALSNMSVSMCGIARRGRFWAEETNYRD